MSLTVTKIQTVLVDFLREKGWRLFAFNTFALSVVKICKYEADMIAVSKNMTCTEFEIKRTRADFFKDFEKLNKHKFLPLGKLHPNYFYFVCEENLIRASEVPPYAGLLYVVELTSKRGKKTYIVNKIKSAPKLHTNTVTDKHLIKILTSVMYKYIAQIK